MLIEMVESVLKKHGLWDKEHNFILGVSGGPDSMVLLHLFCRLGMNVTAAHVNYRKRAEADQEEDLVRSFAGGREGRVSFEAHRSDHRGATGNFQNWARKERRTFFQELKEKQGSAAIVTAHHKDDQIETIIQKVLRGSALPSWQGIAEYDGTYLRPLLGIGKDRIHDYAKQHSVPFSTDYSNFGSAYSRNFIRNEWKPEMDRLFPGWDKNVERLPDRALEYREMLDLILDRVREGPNGLKKTELLQLKPNARKAVVRELTRQLFPDEYISRSALDGLSLEDLQTGRRRPLSGGVFIIRDRQIFTLMKAENSLNSVTLQLEELEKKPLVKMGYQFSVQPFEKPDLKNKLYLNMDKLSPKMHIRNWRPGDSFRPLKLNGTKKVSDYLTEKKVASSKRDQAGVVVTHENKICAVIFHPAEDKFPPGAIDELVRCENVREKCLVIERVNDGAEN